MSPADTTVDILVDEMFQAGCPYADYWTLRLAATGEQVLRGQPPCSYFYPWILFTDDPTINPSFVFTQYRFDTRVRNHPGYDTSEPVILPVFNRNVAPTQDSYIELNLTFDYIGPEILTRFQGTPWEIPEGFGDGWATLLRGTIAMDLTMSKRIFGVVANTPEEAQRWWWANTRFARPSGAVESQFARWLEENGNGKYDIYNGFEWFYQPDLTDLNATVAPDGTTTVTVFADGWGYDALWMRWSYWGNASYYKAVCLEGQRNPLPICDATLPYGTIQPEGWMPMESCWCEKATIHGRIASAGLDLDYQAVQINHLRAWASWGPDGLPKTADDRPIWVFEPMLLDYVPRQGSGQPGASAFPYSELRWYEGLTNIHGTPGSYAYGDPYVYTYVPTRWRLDAGSTLTLILPRFTVTWYDPVRSTWDSIAQIGRYVTFDAPMTLGLVRPAGDYYLWDDAGKVLSIAGPHDWGSTDVPVEGSPWIEFWPGEVVPPGPGPPIIHSLDYRPRPALVNATVEFFANATDPDGGSIQNYHWDFGDGLSTDTLTGFVTHTYRAAGFYTATVTVTDDEGDPASASLIVEVLAIQPPIANDDFDNAIVITSLPFNHTVDTRDATTAPDDPDCVGRGPTVWYSYTPHEDVRIEANTFGSDYDTTLSVYTGTRGALTQIACNDDAIDLQSQAFFNARANVTYYFMVGAYSSGPGGELVFRVNALIPGPPLIAAFNYSPVPAETSIPTVFFVQAYDPDGGLLARFDWTFGDGGFASTRDPQVEHVYDAAGSYTATVRVTDDEGDASTASIVVDVREHVNRLPQACFGWEPQPVVNVTVTFYGYCSYDPDGFIVSWDWDFGDGTGASGPVVTHAYTEPGVYVVTLVVTDNEGGTGTTAAVFDVRENEPPVASFWFTPEVPNPGEYVYFNAYGSYDPDGWIVGWIWDFGDGSGNGSFGPEAYHYYAEGGDYVVTLTVFDNSGANGSVSQAIHVNFRPVAILEASSPTAKVGTPIAFDATSSYDPDGSVASYAWDFGDGGFAEGPVVSHVYGAVGGYVVRLWIVDDRGAVGTADMSIAVVEAKPPVAIIAYAPSRPMVGTPVAFDASNSVDPDGSIPTYIWQFGDGTVAHGVAVGHTYAYAGTFTVKLTVIDEDNLVDRDEATLTVLSTPRADFRHAPSSPVARQPVTFTAVGSFDELGPLTYEWAFGDDGYGTGWQVSHAYAQAGTYRVTLTVRNAYGLATSVSRDLTVASAGPRGIVVGASFVPIGDAQVSVYSGETLLLRTYTDASGRFSFESLPPGSYLLGVTKDGFEARRGAFSWDGKDVELGTWVLQERQDLRIVAILEGSMTIVLAVAALAGGTATLVLYRRRRIAKTSAPKEG